MTTFRRRRHAVVFGPGPRVPLDRETDQLDVGVTNGQSTKDDAGPPTPLPSLRMTRALSYLLDEIQ